MLALGLLLFSQIHKIQITLEYSLTTAALSHVFFLSLIGKAFLILILYLIWANCYFHRVHQIQVTPEHSLTTTALSQAFFPSSNRDSVLDPVLDLGRQIHKIQVTPKHSLSTAAISQCYFLSLTEKAFLILCLIWAYTVIFTDSQNTGYSRTFSNIRCTQPGFFPSSNRESVLDPVLDLGLYCYFTNSPNTGHSRTFSNNRCSQLSFFPCC